MHLLRLFLAGVLLGGTLPAQMPRFAAAVNRMLADPDLRPASVSISVRDVRTGQELYSYDGERALATASTMKAITTATALAVLGPDFRYETLLAIDGELRNGVLFGDLIIVGRGDPTLGSDRLRQQDDLEPLMATWTAAIREAGITEILGSVVADDRYFSTQLTPGNWGWEDMGNYYGAGASGLNIHENLYHLYFSSGSTPGSSTQVVRTEPEMPLFFVNEVVAGPYGSGDNAYIYGAPYTQMRYLRGSIPPGRSAFSIKGSMPDPALFCAQRLTSELAAGGIRVNESATSARLRALAGKPAPRPGEIIHRHQSASLAEIAQACNFYSINLYAEALARTVAVAQNRPGSSQEGAEAMEAFWAAQGVDTRGMRPRDGSGLSPNNAVTASQFSAILAAAARTPYAEAYRASLPVAGESGALRNRMRGTAAAGRVRAKSGYISGVRGYVGYADLPNGQQVSFALLANHFEGSASAMRNRLETLMVTLAAGE